MNLQYIFLSHSKLTGYSKKHHSDFSSLTVSVSVPLSGGLFCVVDRLSLDNFMSRSDRVACTGVTRCTQRTLICRRGRFYAKRCLPTRAARAALSELKSGLPAG